MFERNSDTLQGVSRKDDTLLAPFLEERRILDPKKRIVPLETLLNEYYTIKRYHRNGIPARERLERPG